MKKIFPDIVISGMLSVGLIIAIDHITPRNPVEGYEHLVILVLCFGIVKAVHWMLTQFSNTGNIQEGE